MIFPILFLIFSNIQIPDIFQTFFMMVKLVPHKRCNSAVWNYFHLKCVNGVVHDRSLAVCHICKIEVKFHRGTSSLINNLSSKRPLEYRKTSLKKKLLVFDLRMIIILVFYFQPHNIMY